MLGFYMFTAHETIGLNNLVNHLHFMENYFNDYIL